MAAIIYLTGGAKSGKSSAAEAQIIKSKLKPIAYIATQGNDSQDDEIIRSIEKHQTSRPSTWHTFEQYSKLDQLIQKQANNFQAYLIDCLTLWLTNHLFAFLSDDGKGEADLNIKIQSLSTAETDQLESYLRQELAQLIKAMRQSNACFWVVSNEVGAGIVPANPLARLFRNLQGMLNQQIAQAADEVYWVVSGIPVCIKGGAADNPN